MPLVNEQLLSFLSLYSSYHFRYTCRTILYVYPAEIQETPIIDEIPAHEVTGLLS
jgi:hypothetical protein